MYFTVGFSRAFFSCSSDKSSMFLKRDTPRPVAIFEIANIFFRLISKSVIISFFFIFFYLSHIFYHNVFKNTIPHFYNFKTLWLSKCFFTYLQLVGILLQLAGILCNWLVSYCNWLVSYCNWLVSYCNWLVFYFFATGWYSICNWLVFYFKKSQ